jgi:hypothetical protein
MNYADSILINLEADVDWQLEEKTDGLRAYARMAGWPTEIANSLYVIYEDGDYDWDCEPESYRLQVEDLEYGTQSHPLNPAIRRFFAGAE